MYLDPKYLKYLDKNGFEYMYYLTGKKAIYLDKDGKVQISS